MQRRLNVLVFAYVFPPDAGSGTYRTLYFSNNWVKEGDNVTIITVKEQDFLSSVSCDHGLHEAVHPSIEVVRASAKRPLQKLLAIKNGLRNVFRRNTSATHDVNSIEKTSQLQNLTRGQRILRLLKDTITDLLSCPDEHIGWIPDAVRQGYRITRAARVDCIYATGGPWSCLIAATILHKLCNVPLVLDFRDPWVTNPNLLGKSGLLRSIQTIMESACVKSARVVIANTEELRQDFISRYAYIDPNRFVTITNGFEDITRVTNYSNKHFTIVHAGTLYQSRNPINFLRAIVDLVKDRMLQTETLRVQLVGGISIIDTTIESELRSKVLQSVLEIIPRVSHDEVLLIQQNACALLLIQTGFPLQVPRKLYEYISLARPVLAIAEHNSATARVINELHLGYVAEDNVDSIKSAIMALYRDWKSGEIPSINEEILHTYSNRYLSSRLRDILFNCRIHDDHSTLSK